MAAENERHRALARRCVLAGLAAARGVQRRGRAPALAAGRRRRSLRSRCSCRSPRRSPGIVRGDRRTHAWATLCVVPGFVYGLTEVVANPRLRPIAALVLGASLALFFALVAYLRVTRAGAGGSGVADPADPRAPARRNGTVSRRWATSDASSSRSSTAHSECMSRGRRWTR